MNTYTFIIQGMTCHACESLITMDLEDAGLPAPSAISAAEGKMTITLQEDQVEKVKEVIHATNKYSVVSVDQV